MEFFHLDLGNVLTIMSFLLGGIAFAYTIKSDVRIQAVRLGDIEDELKELRKVVVELARQEERINFMDQRMLSQGQRIDAQGQRITSLDQRISRVEE